MQALPYGYGRRGANRGPIGTKKVRSDTMSTQLEFVQNNVLAGFTGKRGNPWWYEAGQGMESRLFDGAVPRADVEKLFGFEIIDRPVYVEFDGGMIEVPNKRAWIHGTTGDVFGIHSGKYNGHGYNEWLVRNVLTLVGGQADIANAGLLNKAAVAFVQIETPENVSVGGMDIRPFILATTSFDGSVATTYKTGFTNVVCDNTYAGFMREKSDVYRVKHTRNSSFNVTDATAALGILASVAEQTTADINRLLSVDVSDLAWQRFVEAHAPISDDASKKSVTMAENKRQALTQLWRTDVRVAPWSGTAWGVVQAVNTYNQHLSIVRNADREERRMLRAVKGEIAEADTMTLATLGNVIGRELLNV